MNLILTYQRLPGCKSKDASQCLLPGLLSCIWPFEAHLLVLCFSSYISSHVLLVPLQEPLPLLTPLWLAFPGVYPTLFFSIHTPSLNEFLCSYDFNYQLDADDTKISFSSPALLPRPYTSLSTCVPGLLTWPPHGPLSQCSPPLLPATVTGAHGVLHALAVLLPPEELCVSRVSPLYSHPGYASCTCCYNYAV